MCRWGAAGHMAWACSKNVGDNLAVDKVYRACMAGVPPMSDSAWPEGVDPAKGWPSDELAEEAQIMEDMATVHAIAAKWAAWKAVHAGSSATKDEQVVMQAGMRNAPQPDMLANGPKDSFNCFAAGGSSGAVQGPSEVVGTGQGSIGLSGASPGSPSMLLEPPLVAAVAHDGVATRLAACGRMRSSFVASLLVTREAEGLEEGVAWANEVVESSLAGAESLSVLSWLRTGAFLRAPRIDEGTGAGARAGTGVRTRARVRP